MVLLEICFFVLLIIMCRAKGRYCIGLADVSAAGLSLVLRAIFVYSSVLAGFTTLLTLGPKIWPWGLLLLDAMKN